MVRESESSFAWGATRSCRVRVVHIESDVTLAPLRVTVGAHPVDVLAPKKHPEKNADGLFVYALDVKHDGCIQGTGVRVFSEHPIRSASLEVEVTG